MTRPRQFARRAATPLVPAMLAVSLLAVSCGGDGESTSNDLPSLDPAERTGIDEDDSTGGGDGEPSEAELSGQLEAYRQCLLDALPPGSEVDVSLGPGGPGIDISVAEGDVDEEAEAACDAMLNDLERTFADDPEQTAERQAQSETALRCLAERGYESDDDLTLSIGEDGSLNVDVTSAGDFDEEAYLEAERACLAQAGLDG